MNNEITLKFTKHDVNRLLLAAMSIQYDFEREAKETKDEDLRYSRECLAAMWKRICDDIREQRSSQQSEE